MKRLVISLLLLGVFPVLAQSQRLSAGLWKAALLREDGKTIPFIFDLRYSGAAPVIFIHNAAERLEVKQVRQEKDSVFIEMPFFESSFALHIQPDGALKGEWRKAGAAKNIVMPFIAVPGDKKRFGEGKASPFVLGGRWRLEFTRAGGDSRPAIAEFQQTGPVVTGSILTPTGDYRYLEGLVSGDSLYLSTFDGSHAYYFSAAIVDSLTIRGGTFYAGPRYLESFSAVKDDKATLSMESVAMALKPGFERLDFRFPDLDGNLVGITDKRFRNKVVVVQIMGSWCPNCMDETRFLSEFYRKNKQRGIEMVALAYEYTLDTDRSRRSLEKFRQRFQVEYPVLITNATSADSLKTEKTLPQLTPIRSFPSTLFIGKDGKVKKVHGGFFGPATGVEYAQYVQEFEETIQTLLAQ